MRKKFFMVVGTIGFVVMLGACASDSATKSQFIDDLKDEGLTEEQANCVADDLDEKYDLNDLSDTLDEDTDGTSKEAQDTIAAFTACDVDLTKLAAQ